MRFFEEQRKAKNATFWLVLHFIIFVVIISLLIGAACAVAFSKEAFVFLLTDPVLILGHKSFWLAFFLNAFAIAGVSLFRMMQLTSGDVVARMMGGQLVASNAIDDRERRLLNVVEEMSLASGVPMPTVYVLKDHLSVNAFAAGWDPQRAAIAVTKGAIDLLDRDELQGVVAHEFSHILHGDMALNMRLAGVVSGLVFLTEIGQKLTRGSRTRSSSRSGGGQIALLGLALMVLGGIGVFGARLLQSFISRQREHLADASAAQFTRNPNGLARALAKIYHGLGSSVTHEMTLEMSHLFFSNPTRLTFFATHPPLEDRIRLLDKNLNLEEFAERLKFSKYEILKTYTHSNISPKPQPTTSDLFAPAAILASIGQPSYLNVEVTNSNLEKIPKDLLKAAHDPEDSLSVLLGIILSKQPADVQNQVLQVIQKEAPEDLQIISEVENLVTGSASLSFVLLQITLSSLRYLPTDRKSQLVASLINVFKMDGFVSISEALIGVYILDTLSDSRRRNPHGNLKFAEIIKELDTLLFWLIGGGQILHQMPEETKYDDHNLYLKLVSNYHLDPRPAEEIPAVSFEEVRKILERLQRLELPAKSRVIETLWRTTQEKRLTNSDYTENLRLVCSLIGAPVPPFMQFAS